MEFTGDRDNRMGVWSSLTGRFGAVSVSSAGAAGVVDSLTGSGSAHSEALSRILSKVGAAYSKSRRLTLGIKDDQSIAR
jgi:hypothetical protein